MALNFVYTNSNWFSRSILLCCEVEPTTGAMETKNLSVEPTPEYVEIDHAATERVRQVNLKLFLHYKVISFSSVGKEELTELLSLGGMCTLS